MIVTKVHGRGGPGRHPGCGRAGEERDDVTDVAPARKVTPPER